MKNKIIRTINKVRFSFNKIKHNKRAMFLTTVSVLVLFCLVLNIAFGAFTASTRQDAANLVVKDLEYSTSLNKISGNIITATANEITKVNVGITSNNQRTTNYELIYEICTDSSCNNKVESVNDLSVEYSSITLDSVNGQVAENATKNIRVVITNDTSTTYYIKVKVNAGFGYNTLSLKNMIITEYDESDLTIATTVDGVSQNNLPNHCYYDVNITCNKGATGTATCTNNEWNITINNLQQSETKCTAAFEMFVPNGWKTAPTGSLLAGIKENNASPSTPLTTPGVEISLSTEAILASAEDDYGISYYYRGAVENNYVVFANMCWRIVRIDGLGNIKLVLYNYNETSASNPCDSSLDGTTNAFARYSDSTYTSKFNASYNKNAYIGFMYGTPGSSTYEAEHANNNDSTILTNLKTWYDAKFNSDQKALLADTIWCNDKRVVSDTTYDPNGYSNVTGFGYNSEVTHYQAIYRLRTYNSQSESYDTSNAAPSLTCGSSMNDNKISKYTGTDTTYGNGDLNGYKIGLLTADEVAFAGSKYSSADSNYYLYKNANGANWWTLSPYSFTGSIAREWLVAPNGYLNHVQVHITDYAIRPSVSLKNSVMISGGTGTQASPFVVAD